MIAASQDPRNSQQPLLLVSLKAPPLIFLPFTSKSRRVSFLSFSLLVFLSIVVFLFFTVASILLRSAGFGRGRPLRTETHYSTRICLRVASNVASPSGVNGLPASTGVVIAKSYGRRSRCNRSFGSGWSSPSLLLNRYASSDEPRTWPGRATPFDAFRISRIQIFDGLPLNLELLAFSLGPFLRASHL